MKKDIKNQIYQNISLTEEILRNEEILSQVENTIDKILKCYENGGKLLIAGNGGSASDSQHIAAEFVSKFKRDRIALPAIALTVDTSILTSIGNDSIFERVFSRQIEAFGNEKDIFIALTTSGNSKNIIMALKQAKKQNLFTIVFNGRDGGAIHKENLCDINIIIPSKNTARIQEAQMVLYHIMCDIIEERFCEK